MKKATKKRKQGEKAGEMRDAKKARKAAFAICKLPSDAWLVVVAVCRQDDPSLSGDSTNSMLFD